jgi:hypothetical protein
MKKPYNLYSKEKGTMTGKGMIKTITRGLAGLLLVMCLMTMSSVVSVQAEDYVMYVDGYNGGDDAPYDGSMGLPWKTMARAFSEIGTLNMNLDDNLVIYVGTGDYSIANNEDDSASTYVIMTPNIAIKGAGGGSTIIDGTDAGSWITGFTIEADNITITEILFKNFTNASSSGVAVNSGDNVKIMNCYFTSNTQGVILIGSSASATTPPVLMGNTFLDNTSSGIRVVHEDDTEYSPLILANKLSGNPTGISLTIQGSGNSVLSPKIRNNLIYIPSTANGSYNYAITLGYTMYPSDQLNPEIIHNTLDGGGLCTTGINIGYMYGSANPLIRYNIITNFQSYGIFKDFSATGALDIDYNNSYDNGIAAADNYYNIDTTGTHNISADPLYSDSGDFSIANSSPCADAIPYDVEAEDSVSDPIVSDIKGTGRPRASASGKPRNYDIGCYEFPYKEFTLKLPGGRGRPMDYKMMSMPLDMDEKLSPIEVFESVYGPYDPSQCRIFSYVNGTAPPLYTEINSGASGTEDVGYNDGTMSFEGSAFWVISRNTDALVFGGQLISNKRPFTVILSQGWNMVANPWADSSENDNIELGYITVSTMDSKHYLLELENTLTEQAVWTYSETGYRKLVNSEDTLDIGKSYWIYAQTDGVTLTIPPDNTGDFVAKSRTKGSKNAKNMTPPLPPGSGLTAVGGNGCFIGSTF